MTGIFGSLSQQGTILSLTFHKANGCQSEGIIQQSKIAIYNSKGLDLHYENSAYDTLMAIIANAADGTARMGCLHDAEELLMDDAPLVPLYTMETAWEGRETISGMFRDERGWFGFAGAIRKSA